MHKTKSKNHQFLCCGKALKKPKIEYFGKGKNSPIWDEMLAVWGASLGIIWWGLSRVAQLSRADYLLWVIPCELPAVDYPHAHCPPYVCLPSSCPVHPFFPICLPHCVHLSPVPCPSHEGSHVSFSRVSFYWKWFFPREFLPTRDILSQVFPHKIFSMEVSHTSFFPCEIFPSFFSHEVFF